jgi:hypothetical protein
VDLALPNDGALNVKVTAVKAGEQDIAYFSSYSFPIYLLNGSFTAKESPVLTMEPVVAQAATTADECAPVAPRRLAFEPGVTTKVAELHSWDDMTSKILNQRTSTHRVDVAAKINGGPLVITGSAARSEDKGLGYGAEKTGRYGRIWAQAFDYELLEEKHSTPPPITPGAPNCLIVVEHTAHAINTVSGFVDDSPQGNDPSFDVSRWDGPGEYVRAKQQGRESPFSAGAFAFKNTGLTQRYELAAEVFGQYGGFSIGTVSEYSENLRYDWKMGQQFTPGQKYHLWGSNGKMETATNVYAYAGPDPVVPNPPPVNFRPNGSQYPSCGSAQNPCANALLWNPPDGIVVGKYRVYTDTPGDHTDPNPTGPCASAGVHMVAEFDSNVTQYGPSPWPACGVEASYYNGDWIMVDYYVTAVDLLGVESAPSNRVQAAYLTYYNPYCC